MVKQATSTEAVAKASEPELDKKKSWDVTKLYHSDFVASYLFPRGYSVDRCWILLPLVFCLLPSRKQLDLIVNLDTWKMRAVAVADFKII